MKKQNSLETLQYCIDEIKRKGADAADAFMVESEGVTVRSRLGATETVERAETKDLGLRIFFSTNKGMKQAIVSSNDISKNVLDRMIEQGIAMAKHAPEDPYMELAQHSELSAQDRNLDLYDANEPSVESLIESAKKTEAAALAVKGVANSEGAEAHYGHNRLSLVTSHLFAKQFDTTSSFISVSVVAGAGAKMETDYDYSIARYFADLKAPEKIGKIAGDRAVAKLNSRKVGTCQVPVVFEARIAKDLVSTFASAINGAAIARKTSFLKDKMGEAIFPKGINIIDDPLKKKGLASKPFDAEGVNSEKIALVENGVLKSWLLDVRSAKHLGLKTNGRAARGVSSPPSPSSTNLYMENGKISLKELISDIKNGFYITEAFGMGINTVTGDYSQGASGFWIENGEITYAVSEVTIAGNLSEMFKNLTPANDLEHSHAINSPTVRVEGMTIAGD